MAPERSASTTTSPATDRAPARADVATRVVPVGPVRIGGGHPLALLAGPCAIQDEAHALRTAEALVRIAADAGVPFVYKSSYDKANRSSARSYRGPGPPGRTAGPPPRARDVRMPRALGRPRARGGAGGGRGPRPRPDPRVPLPPDRPGPRLRPERPPGERQEGPVPRALGHAQRRREAAEAPGARTCS